MDLRQIRAFVAVYEAGSINRAAARLNIAQPSLSVQLRALEDELDIALFDRRPRGVAPTPAGLDFYRHCQTILGAVEGARQDMRHLGREVAGPLEVGLIPTIAKGALARVLPGFTDDFPKVALRVAEAFSGTLTEWVLSGEIDFAIVTEPPVPQDGLVLRLIARDPMVLVSGRQGGRTPFAPVRLAGMTAPLRLELPSARHTLRQAVDRDVRAGNIAPTQTLEIDGLYGSLAFVRRSDWVVILPATSIVDELDDEEMVAQPIIDATAPLDYYLVHRERRPLSPAARLLAARLDTELARSAAAWAEAVARARGTTEAA